MGVCRGFLWPSSADSVAQLQAKDAEAKELQAINAALKSEAQSLQEEVSQSCPCTATKEATPCFPSRPHQSVVMYIWCFFPRTTALPFCDDNSWNKNAGLATP